MTEKLYDLNSYVSEFMCKVISLYSDNNYIYIETDRTAFFPEGGGQTSDIGWLDNVYVENVQIINGKIQHIVENSEENMEKLKNCTSLAGKIDMKKRFSDMQQHSGEHIFSGIVHNLFGYDNVGFHLGTEVVTLDFNGTLTESDICKVELLVNKAIWDNLDIKVSYPTDEELASINYRSKKEIDGAIRIVEIPGIDICACCAPHVKMTGEIGIVKVVGYEKYKGGIRLSILCGERALKDIETKFSENHKISTYLSAKEHETSLAVKRLMEENSGLKQEIYLIKKELLKTKAEQIEKSPKIIIFDDSLTGNLLRDFSAMLMDKAEKFVAVFAKVGDTFKYTIGSSSLDVREIGKSLNSAFNGRGGGKPEFIQGSIVGSEEEVKNLLMVL